jgi:hypothetical protein
MPALTRRRYLEYRDECWHIFYGDVHVGTIGIREGVPVDEDQWGWSCGFYPVSHRGQEEDGTAANFAQARLEFEAAWRRLLSKVTETDFQAWRDERDWTERKYALWEAGKCLPPHEWEPGKPCSIYLKCPCGDIFNSHQLNENLVHVPHITAAHAIDGISR